MSRAFGLLLPLLSLATAAGEVSFEQDVYPVLSRHCLICHMEGDAQGGLSLYPEAWETLSGAPSSQSSLLIVRPGSVEQSYLYHKLLDTQGTVSGKGRKMPFEPNALEPQELETIRLWIEQGAKQN